MIFFFKGRDGNDSNRFPLDPPLLMFNPWPIPNQAHRKHLLQSTYNYWFCPTYLCWVPSCIPLKGLHCALLCLILKYDCVLRDPSITSTNASAERFQRKFLRILVVRLNIPHPPYDYLPVLHAINISSLADRQNLSNLSFLSNFLSGKIDCHFLSSQINFKVSPRTTHCSIHFYISRSSNNCLENVSIIHHMRTTNLSLKLLFFSFLHNVHNVFYTS